MELNINFIRILFYYDILLNNFVAFKICSVKDFFAFLMDTKLSKGRFIGSLRLCHPSIFSEFLPIYF